MDIFAVSPITYVLVTYLLIIVAITNATESETTPAPSGLGGALEEFIKNEVSRQTRQINTNAIIEVVLRKIQNDIDGTVDRKVTEAMQNSKAIQAMLYSKVDKLQKILASLDRRYINMYKETQEALECNPCKQVPAMVPEWGEWGEWMPCDKTCGTFSFSWRHRNCTRNADCGGVYREGRQCNTTVCPTNPTPCYSNPCQNGGTCTNDGERYICHCKIGFTGMNCENDACHSNPCYRGVCHTDGGRFICTCSPGFTGLYCHDDLHCHSNPCQNGGTCTNYGWRYICQCKFGFTGINCENAPCYSNPCQNGGTCTNDGGQYICHCKIGFTGMNCENDACHSNPCYRGVCHTDGGRFICTCSPGFTGLYCHYGPPCHSNPCQNGGSCRADGGRYVCTCPPGFTGANCQNAPCYSNPCQNGGTCIIDGGRYICQCKFGFYGINCENAPCHSNPCQNGGSCTADGGRYVCACPPGYTGANCQNGPCHNNPCKNGGTCTADGGKYTCKCVAGYTGSNCQILCRGRADICLVVDGSSSIRLSNVEGEEDNWELLLEFLVNLVTPIQIGQNDSHVAVVSFSDKAKVEFNLEQYMDKDQMIQAIRQIPYQDGWRNTSAGIYLMRTAVFDPTHTNHKGDRKNAINIGVVITDGASDYDKHFTIPFANDAKADGIHMLSVGITFAVNTRELRGMSSSGILGGRLTYWKSPNFEVRSEIIDNIINEACTAGSNRKGG